MRRALPIIAALLAAPALAVPVDNTIDMVVGDTQFLHLAEVKAFECEPKNVATVEALPAGEILLTARGPGRALLYLVDSMRTAAWRIRVRETGGRTPEVVPSEEARKAATSACPGFKEEKESDGVGVSATVISPACRRALKRLLDADGYRAKYCDLTFTMETLQDQLADIGERLQAAGLPAIKARYEGATLLVSGALPHGGWTRLARAFYEAGVGRVPPDLQVEEAAEADGGHLVNTPAGGKP